MIAIATIVRKFPDEGENILVVALNEKYRAIGTVTVRLTTAKTGPRAAVFSALFVDPDFRRQHIGRNLLNVCDEIAQRENCDILTGYVKPANIEAQAFYRKLGFTWGYIWDDGDVAITRPVLRAGEGELYPPGHSKNP